MKKKALVICPGRGTYNKDELGYLRRYHADKREFIAAVDAYRAARGQSSISALDGQAKFSLAEHSRGDNAAALIYACAYADFLSIDRSKYDVVAVTGNSMGWYIALACGSAATPMNALHLINTMGTLMHENLSGGQMIYSLVDENWKKINGRRDYLMKLIGDINGKGDCELYISIEFGGMLVFGGNDKALAVLEKTLKAEGRFPMRLQNHAAFHTPMMRPISDHALTIMGDDLFQQPSVPLIDGRGAVWQPHATDIPAIQRYTLGHQVCETYDFTRAVQVSVKEFAPDCLIILGPGSTLGGAVAQSLIDIGWQRWQSKDDFTSRQKTDPYILSMGLEEQRGMVVV